MHPVSFASGRFVPAGEVTLHYADTGAADLPTLVLLHALGCDLNVWSAVEPAFASTHRVVAYDLRGHGLSDCGPAECTLADHARDLDALLTQLGITSATLAGISVGGMIALETALRFPTRVRSLVLCATGARLGTRESWNERILAVRERGLEAIADAILARWFAADFATREPATFRGHRNRLTRTPAAGYLATCVALREADLRERLGEIRVPALVLSGEHDVAAPPAIGRALADGLPDARFELIRGTAHLPPVEQPAATIAAMAAFLKS
jgi:3-oxoadipate enol-lactonase